MGLSCGANTVRVIIVILSVALCGLGCFLMYTTVHPHVSRDKALPPLPKNADFWVAVIKESLMILTGFFGCCGAFIKSRCFLGLFNTVLVMIGIALIVSMILNGVYRSKHTENLKHSYESKMDKYGQNTADGMQWTLSWDYLQIKYKCCGSTGPQSWISAGVTTTPNSCCSSGKTCARADAYTTGCDQYYGEAAKTTWILSMVFNAAALGVIVLQLMFSCCLDKAIRDEDAHV